MSLPLEAALSQLDIFFSEIDFRKAQDPSYRKPFFANKHLLTEYRKQMILEFLQDTSAEDFVSWLMLCGIIVFNRSEEGTELRNILTAQLKSLESSADQSEYRFGEHRVLFIESQIEQSEGFKEYLLDFAENVSISQDNITFDFQEDPAEDIEGWVTQLTQYTSLVLHNLSLMDLMNLNQALEALSEKPKVVVVMTGGTATDIHIELYSQLKENGCVLVRKPFRLFKVADHILRV